MPSIRDEDENGLIQRVVRQAVTPYAGMRYEQCHRILVTSVSYIRDNVVAPVTWLRHAHRRVVLFSPLSYCRHQCHRRYRPRQYGYQHEHVTVGYHSTPGDEHHTPAHHSLISLLIVIPPVSLFNNKCHTARQARQGYYVRSLRHRRRDTGESVNYRKFARHVHWGDATSVVRIPCY